MYHVGLMVSKARPDGTRTAIYQMRKEIDCLDCEILDYLGRSSKTKKQARQDLKGKEGLFIKALNLRYPRQNIARVIIN